MMRRKLVVPRKSGRLGSVAGSVVEYVICITNPILYCLSNIGVGYY
jgi:hypothetical protein